MLYVLDACIQSATSLACNDDIDFALGNIQSEVTVTLSAGQTVYVVVDGYDSAEFGTYILNVQ